MDEQPTAQADGAATDERIAEIREREQDATPGPWACYEPTPPDPDDGLWVMYETPEDGWVHTITHGDNCFTEDDAHFVAHARDDIPYLLTRIDALTTERDDLAARLAGVMEAVVGRFNDRSAWQCAICLAWSTVSRGAVVHDGDCILAVTATERQGAPGARGGEATD